MPVPLLVDCNCFSIGNNVPDTIVCSIIRYVVPEFAVGTHEQHVDVDIDESAATQPVVSALFQTNLRPLILPPVPFRPLHLNFLGLVFDLIKGTVWDTTSLIMECSVSVTSRVSSEILRIYADMRYSADS